MKKRFGQHLLIDRDYLKKIVDVAELKSSDTVLEIGAGDGLLTCFMAKKVKKVFAVELERTILKKLKENIISQQLTNVDIIEANFLNLSLSNFQFPISNLQVIGNIPYNITSKILLKLFGEIDAPALHLKFLSNIYLMLQKEVAERIVAKPHSKAYSPLTLLVQFFSMPKILFNVPRTAFYPIPKVDSAFVYFSVKENLPRVKNPPLLKNIIRTSFQQRRKKVIKLLGKLFDDKKELVGVFNKLNLDHNLRAEDLTFNDYLALCDSRHQ